MIYSGCRKSKNPINLKKIIFFVILSFYHNSAVRALKSTYGSSEYVSYIFIAKSIDVMFPSLFPTKNFGFKCLTLRWLKNSLLIVAHL